MRAPATEQDENLKKSAQKRDAGIKLWRKVIWKSALERPFGGFFFSGRPVRGLLMEKFCGL